MKSTCLREVSDGRDLAPDSENPRGPSAEERWRLISDKAPRLHAVQLLHKLMHGSHPCSCIPLGEEVPTYATMPSGYYGGIPPCPPMPTAGYPSSYGASAVPPDYGCGISPSMPPDYGGGTGPAWPPSYGAGPCTPSTSAMGCPYSSHPLSCNANGSSSGGIVCLAAGSDCSSAASIDPSMTPSCDSMGPCAPSAATGLGGCPSDRPLSCFVNEGSLILCFPYGFCPDASSTFPTPAPSCPSLPPAFAAPCTPLTSGMGCPLNSGHPISCGLIGGGIVCLAAGSDCSSASSIDFALTPSCDMGPCMPPPTGFCPVDRPVSCLVNGGSTTLCFSPGFCPNASSIFSTPALPAPNCSSQGGYPPAPSMFNGSELKLVISRTGRRYGFKNDSDFASTSPFCSPPPHPAPFLWMLQPL